MSEYGDVVYRLGNEDYWEIYKETVEEWKAEKEFLWNQLAFIALDPTSTDQFIAIRNDGTWAGSIDDANENALETFALNFFAKAKPKHKSKPSTSQRSEPLPEVPKLQDLKPDPKIQMLYEKWSNETATLFASASAANGGSKPRTPRKLQVRSPSNGSEPSTPPLQHMSSASSKLLSTFPFLPSTITTCNLTTCTILKSEVDSIHACQHDVEKLLRASGLYSFEWLRQERIRWHPDRFGRLCEESWRKTGERLAGEMFKLMSVLIEDLKVTENDDSKRSS